MRPAPFFTVGDLISVSLTANPCVELFTEDHKVITDLWQKTNLTFANDSSVLCTTNTADVLTVFTVLQIVLLAITRHVGHDIWMFAYLRLGEIHQLRFTHIPARRKRGTTLDKNFNALSNKVIRNIFLKRITLDTNEQNTDRNLHP